MEFRTLRLDTDGAIARVLLTRPADANRIDSRTLRELAEACAEIDRTDSLSLVLLTAEGADFCAGWADSLEEPPSLDPFGPLAKLPLPVVCAVQGAAVSAGLELALASDIRIAAHSARFSLPEVSQGTLPRAGGSQRLPRVVGRSIATSMLLLGEELDAQAAYRAGLVSRVVPGKDLLKEAETLVSRIAAHGPLALRYAKEAVHHGADLTLDQALRFELDLSVILQTTHDRAEGVEAFLDKRDAHFEGR